MRVVIYRNNDVTLENQIEFRNVYRVLAHEGGHVHLYHRHPRYKFTSADEPFRVIPPGQFLSIRDK